MNVMIYHATNRPPFDYPLLWAGQSNENETASE